MANAQVQLLQTCFTSKREKPIQNQTKVTVDRLHYKDGHAVTHFDSNQ